MVGARPAAKILSEEGDDLSSQWSQRLLRVRVEETEQDGEADTVEVTLDDRGARVPIPRIGEKIRVLLGYLDAGGLRLMGDFVVDERHAQGPPLTIGFGGTAAAFARTRLSEARVASWHNTTLGEVVNRIAARHGLRGMCHPDCASISIPHIDQQRESDIALLRRIARRYDLSLRFDAQTLTLRPHASTLPASDEPAEGHAPRVRLHLRDVIKFDYHESHRAHARGARAGFHDAATGRLVEVVEGDASERVATVRQPAFDEAEARLLASARLRQSKRATANLTLVLPGRPDLICGARLMIQGVAEPVGGEWSIERVEHEIDEAGYRTTLTAVPPDSKRRADDYSSLVEIVD